MMKQSSPVVSPLEREASHAVANQLWRLLQGEALSDDELAALMDSSAAPRKARPLSGADWSFSAAQVESSVRFVLGSERRRGGARPRADGRRHRLPALQWLERRDLMSGLADAPHAVPFDAIDQSEAEVRWHFSRLTTEHLFGAAEQGQGTRIQPSLFGGVAFDAGASHSPAHCDVVLASAADYWRLDLDAALAQIAEDVNHAWAA